MGTAQRAGRAGGGARAQCAASAGTRSRGRLVGQDGPFLRRGPGDAAGDAEAAVPEREGENHWRSLPRVRRGDPLTSGGN